MSEGRVGSLRALWIDPERDQSGDGMRVGSCGSWSDQHRTVYLATALILLLAKPLAAQVVLDGTIGAGPGPVLGGEDNLGQDSTYLIHDGLGEQTGGSLYFSFDQFSIGADDTATFMSTSVTPIDFVLSRVTGGSHSQINGTLRSTIPGASLFLMNPGGVVFGEGSSIDVPGSLHVTTADYLRHTDGTQFPATATVPTALSTAPIDAFGFWDADVGNITVEDTLLDGAPGETLSLIGGDVEITRGTLDLSSLGVPGLVAIQVPGGRLNLAAVASPGEVAFDDSHAAPRLDVDSFEELGQIRMAEHASILNGGDPAGTVVIRAQDFQMHDDPPFPFPPGLSLFVVSQGAIDHPGVGVDIAVRGEVRIANGQIAAAPTGSGSGGDIRLDVGTLSIEPGSTILTTIGGGPAGDIVIAADAVFLQGIDPPAGVPPPEFGWAPLTRIHGHAIDISARLIESRSSMIRSSLVTISADELRVLAGGGILSASGGDVQIHARSILVRGRLDSADGHTLDRSSRISNESSGSGDAGSIVIDAEELTIIDGGLEALTFAEGDSGDISVTANHIVLDSVAEHVDPSGPWGISTDTAGSGDGGKITIKTDELLVRSRHKAISASSLPLLQFPFSDAGDAGDIVIDAGKITLVDSGAIQTATVDHVSEGVRYKAGSGGSIDIRADELQLLDGGVILASSLASGSAGNITVHAPSIVISGVNPDPDVSNRGPISGIDSSAFAFGKGGNVEIEAGELTLLDGGSIGAGTRSAVGAPGGDVSVTADRITVSGTGVRPDGPPHASRITASSLPQGPPGVFPPPGVIPRGPTTGVAGSVSIVAGDVLRVENGGEISASSESTDAGDVTIRAGNGVELNRGSITTAVAGEAETEGGNIEVSADYVVLLNGSEIVTTATEGTGGTIEINTRALFKSADSTIDADSDRGVSGQVRVNAPDSNLMAGLAPLSEQYLVQVAFASDQCSIGGGEDRGSFVLGGGVGIPEAPDAPLPSFALGSRRVMP